jgi:hypothetical protein
MNAWPESTAGFPERMTLTEHFTILTRCASHWLDFQAYVVTGFADDRRLYGDDAGIEDFRTAEPFATGYLKWDGCNEWWLNENDNHFCAPLSFAEHIRELAETITAIATEDMERTDYERIEL